MTVFTKKDQKILYIHVPKTGGTSIHEFFKCNGYEVSYYTEGYKGLCSPQHLHAELIKKKFDLSEFSYIFSTFRDPIERLISEYVWRSCIFDEINLSLETWIKLIFEHYHYHNNYVNDNHIRPQNEFYFEGLDVYDFNDIQNLESKLRSKLEIDGNIPLGKHNSFNSSRYIHNLTDHCKNLIMKFYRDDYQWIKNNNLL